MDDAAFCPTERKTLLTLQSQQHFNWFRLDSDGAHKVHKCTSNISLHCGFKELSIKGLKTAMHIKCTSAHSNISLYYGFKELSVKGLKNANKHCVLHNAVSYLNKGCHLHTWGEETIILYLFKTSQGICRRILCLLRNTKVLKVACYCPIVVLQMLTEKWLSNSLGAMIDQVHNPSGHTLALG